MGESSHNIISLPLFSWTHAAPAVSDGEGGRGTGEGPIPALKRRARLDVFFAPDVAKCLPPPAPPASPARTRPSVHGFPIKPLSYLQHIDYRMSYPLNADASVFTEGEAFARVATDEKVSFGINLGRNAITGIPN